MENIHNYSQLIKYLLLDSTKYPNMDSIYELGSHLRLFPFKKKRGGTRRCFRLKNKKTDRKGVDKIIQDGLEELYINKTPSNIQNHVHGFLKGKGIIQNAQIHINQRIVINLDIHKFFDNISVDKIINSLCDSYGINKFIAEFLANYLTKQNKLVTGISPSPILSNLVIVKLDKEIIEYTSNKSINYSRYADDLTFSSKKFLSKVDTQIIIQDIEKTIKKYDFNLNKNKKTFYTSRRAQFVTGLTVNDSIRPRLPKKVKRNFRLESYYMAKFGVEDHLKRSKDPTYVFKYISHKSNIFKVEGERYENSIKQIYTKFKKHI